MKMTTVCWIFAGLVFICPCLLTSSSECRRNAFKCSSSGACIPLHWRCDGKYQCGGGDTTDEVNCTSDWKGRCPQGSYRCSNSRCLPDQWVCDGESQCVDGSDEEVNDCRIPSDFCLRNQLHCTMYVCIARHLSCDNKIDCPVNSRDEMHCESAVCSRPGEHRCGSGSCLSPLLLCDGLPQCNDTSDERDCDKCENWGCGHDCNETSDGPQCYCRQGFDLDPEDGRTCKAHCLRNQFRCLDGEKCIPINDLCNGRADCNDGSDEDNLMCADRKCPIGQQLKCDGGWCLPDKFICDGKWDCDDHTDESDCPTPPVGSCMENQFQCANGSCFPLEFRCKGSLRQCLGRSDELECDGSLMCVEAYERPCDVGNYCVWKSRVCDGQRHCHDDSDEEDCYTCQNWGCSQTCTETSNWPRCHCNYGFVLDDRDQKTCNPIYLVFTIDSSSSTAYVHKTGKFILSCRVGGQGPHLWYKDGSAILANSINKFHLEPDSTVFSPEDNEYVTTMRLVVEEADSIHTGEYKCGRDGLYSQNVIVLTDPLTCSP